MSSMWTFLLIWGVWLITPVAVDGGDALWRLVSVMVNARRRKKRIRTVGEHELPMMSVIIPAHNEAQVIDRCINSVKAQNYPHDRLEIIVVDDGSTDETGERVERHVNGEAGEGSYLLRGKPIRVGKFDGVLALIKNGQQGKAHALNAGLHASRGDIVMNIDSDVVLHPDAIRRIAEYFVLNPSIDAATGNIEIDWDILEQRDRDGVLVTDEDGDIVPRELTRFQRWIVRSQYLEYLSAFDLGRRSQALSGTLYSLAGACSAFRRTVFDEEGLSYSSETVSEDTLMTFALHRRGLKIGYVQSARIHLEPVIDWDTLYSQRVRWARGQMEVVGVNRDLIGSGTSGRFSRFAVPKMLVFDHTLAFPRFIWVYLILCFPLIGYSWKLLGVAIAAIYLFYLITEAVSSITAYTLSDRRTKLRIEQSEWAILTMPLYRFIVFHFRMSGFLASLTEPQQWNTPGPVKLARSDAKWMRLRSIEVVTGLLGAIPQDSPLRHPVPLALITRFAEASERFRIRAVRVTRAVAATVLPVMLATAVMLREFFDQRRPS